MTNSTISGNAAFDGPGGGILVDSGAGAALLVNCTISDNYAPKMGGGIDNFAAATITIRNTIIAGNTFSYGGPYGGPDCWGSFTSAGYNLIGATNDSTGWGALDQTGTTNNPINPLLGSLQDNGGPTPTMMPLSVSPAIDRGNTGGILTDQRGCLRPYTNSTIISIPFGGDHSEIGAVEAGILPGGGAKVYFSGTGHWYEPVKVPTGVTWFDAYTVATNRGGYLCTISNAAENTFAASLVDLSYYSDGSVNGDILGPWLGGLRPANNPQWHWVSGEPFSYAPWYAGQPDGYGGSEQRLQFYARFTTGSTWGDHPGGPIPGYSLPRGFIVEYNNFPNPPKLTVTRSNNIVVISWPQSGTNWMLTTTAALSNSPIWTVIPSGQYQTTLTGMFITVTNPVGSAFYRLRLTQ